MSLQGITSTTAIWEGLSTAGSLWLIPTVVGGICLTLTWVPEARMRALQRELQNAIKKVNMPITKPLEETGLSLSTLLFLILVSVVGLVVLSIWLPILALLKVLQLDRVFRSLQKMSVLEGALLLPKQLAAAIIGIYDLGVVGASRAVSTVVWVGESLTRRRVVRAISTVAFAAGVLPQLLFGLG
jgi:hypothetical protein